MNEETGAQLDPRTVMASLRPQPFGVGHPERVPDPVIEPMWSGRRVLASIDGVEVVLADASGASITEHVDVNAALAEAAVASGLVIDGFLTRLPDRDGSGVYVALDDLPTSSQLAGRSLMGIRRTRTEDLTKAKEAASTFGPEDVVTFVAIDLLWLDGESLLDVPLLERRRLLESVLDESDLVRRGVFVRPPVDAWIGSWRALGFTELSFKAANSRYRPGTESNDWVSVPMPRR